MTRPYYSLRLESELLQRQRKNKSYTLRAFSRDLGLAPPVVSEIFRGKRKLPLKYADRITEVLELSPAEKHRFLQSLLSKKTSLKDLARFTLDQSDQLLDEEKNFRIISEWEYYAVLSLMDLKSFQGSPQWISARLGISEKRAKEVLTHLNQSEFILKKGKKLIKKHQRLTTTQDIYSTALRKSHKESLELAAEKIDQVSIEDRFYSSSTFSVDVSKIDEAKEIIREFRKKLSHLLTGKNPTEVYQFCCQLFPITQIKEKK